jgi:hypothetical protein
VQTFQAITLLSFHKSCFTPNNAKPVNNNPPLEPLKQQNTQSQPPKPAAQTATKSSGTPQPQSGNWFTEL